MTGPGPQVRGREVLHDPAGVHDQDAVADVGDHRDVVADQEERGPLLAADVLQQRQHLALHRHVEGGGRLVGDDEPGAAHEAHADHGALPHAAGELEGVLAGPALGLADPDRAQPVDGAGGGRLAAEALMVAADLGELAADAHGGVEGRHRVLEDDREGGAEQLVVRALEQVGAAEGEVLRVDPAGLLDQLRDRQGRQGLAGPRLADDADGLPGTDAEGQSAHGPDRPVRAREGDPQIADVQDELAVCHVVVPEVGRRRLAARRVQRLSEAGRRRDAEGPGDRLSGEVEGQAGDDDHDAGRERGQRVHVDAAQAVLHQPAPVVGRRLHAEPEEGQAGEAEQDRARRDRDVHDERLGHVGQHVPGHDPQPADAGDAGGRDVLEAGDAGDQRLAEPGHARRDGDADGEHRAARADAEDDCEHQDQQQAGERDEHVDDRRDQPSEPPFEQQRCDAEQQADHRPERGREERQHQRQSRRDEHAEEQVAAQVVGAEPVLRRGTGQQVLGVDGAGAVAPEDGGQDRQEHGEGEQAQPDHADGGLVDARPAAGHHRSPIVERGSSTASATSTSVLMTSTPTP